MSYRILVDSRLSPDDVYEKTKDEEYNIGQWITVKNISEFAKVIQNNLYDNEVMPELISWEFNLGFDILDKKINPKAETAPDLIKWLITFCEQRGQRFPDHLVHSEDQNQARDLRTLLRNSKEYYGL